jgi:hemerythrin-like metal-binding protein
VQVVGWDTSLETGDALIDAQHREVFELIAKLEVLPSDDPAVILDVAGQIMEHVDVHFSMEEDLMRRWSYPAADVEEHCEEHRSLKDRARSAVLDVRTGRVATTAPMVEFLRTWLTDHIDDLDRRLVDYIRERRASGADFE